MLRDNQQLSVVVDHDEPFVSVNVEHDDDEDNDDEDNDDDLQRRDDDEQLGWMILRGSRGPLAKTLLLLSHTLLALTVFAVALTRIDLIHLVYMFFTVALLASRATTTSTIWLFLRLYNLAATVLLLLFATPFTNNETARYSQLGQ